MSAPMPGQSMGPETTKFARIDPGPSRGFGIVASVVTDLGALLVVLSFLVLDWFDRAALGRSAGFRGVHDLLDAAGPAATGLASAYFSWLGWGLLAVAFVCAVIAAIPTVGRPFRVIAPSVAAVAILVTVLAVKLFTGADDARSYGDYVDSATTGFFAALAGFALIGIGGAIGPRRQAR